MKNKDSNTRGASNLEHIESAIDLSGAHLLQDRLRTNVYTQ